MAPIGDWLRNYRAGKRLTLREMARRVGVSAAYLSAVEVDRKQPTKRLLDDIVEKLGVVQEEALGLRRAADQSVRVVKVALGNGPSKGDAEVAALFARNFGQLDDEQKAAIRRILEE